MRKEEDVKEKVEGAEVENTECEEGNRGTFAGFVLLSEPKFDKKNIQKALWENWKIKAEENKDEQDKLDGQDKSDENKGNDDEILIFNIEDSMVVISLIPCAVPDGETEEAALTNYLWREAAETVKKHQAHILVSVLGNDADDMEKGELFVKVVSTICRQNGALGVYTNGTVYQPEFYAEAAEMLREEEFPMLNLIWFGLWQSEKGIAGYTNGLKSFGKDEIEVMAEDVSPSEIRDFLLDIVSYVVLEDVTLQDGETIGFTEEQQLTITKSEGWAVEGKSLKIEFGRME